MIQAGTISTGSARTVSVTGAYWISSIRWLRKMTLPGVVATFQPILNASVPTGGCLARCGTIVDPVGQTGREVLAAGSDGLLRHDRVGP